jgi:hypothetical protein
VLSDELVVAGLGRGVVVDSELFPAIPNTASTPSPMNFTTVPAWSSIVERNNSK